MSESSDGEDKEQVPETHYSVPRTRFRKRIRSPSQERQHTGPSSRATRAAAKVCLHCPFFLRMCASPAVVGAVGMVVAVEETCLWGYGCAPC
jgi:hypothetical protein